MRAPSTRPPPPLLPSADNFWRWFPRGKVIFLAPTRPLVAQQIKACFDIVRLPEVETAKLDSTTKPKERAALWREKRVFFCTPQTVYNDIVAKRCDARQVTLIVVDEGACGGGGGGGGRRGHA